MTRLGQRQKFILEDQEVESEILTNAEAPRPYEIPIVHMPHPNDFVGIQNFRPMVNHQLLVMVSKDADIPDTCTDP
jgi:ureidoglycolate hydrolase